MKDDFDTQLEDLGKPDSQACPGCGCMPGEGMTPECNDPNGCGYWRQQHNANAEERPPLSVEIPPEIQQQIIDVVVGHSVGADMDAGFDAGEFSGPAHSDMEQEALQMIANENNIPLQDVITFAQYYVPEEAMQAAWDKAMGPANESHDKMYRAGWNEEPHNLTPGDPNYRQNLASYNRGIRDRNRSESQPLCSCGCPKSDHNRQGCRHCKKCKAFSAEESQIEEGYERAVLNVLRQAGIRGFFQNGTLYVPDHKINDAGEALEASNVLSKLPPVEPESEADVATVESMAKQLLTTLLESPDMAHCTNCGKSHPAGQPKPCMVDKEEEHPMKRHYARMQRDARRVKSDGSQA